MSNTVYVIQGQNKHKTRYHDGEKSCSSSKKATDLEELTIEEAEIRGLTRCKRCAGEVDTSGQDLSYQNALKQAAAGGD